MDGVCEQGRDAVSQPQPDIPEAPLAAAKSTSKRSHRQRTGNAIGIEAVFALEFLDRKRGLRTELPVAGDCVSGRNKHGLEFKNVPTGRAAAQK